MSTHKTQTATTAITKKRITKVTIHVMIDENPDTSWLGEYSDRATSDYSIDRAHSEDCLSVEVNHREVVAMLERVIEYLNLKSGEELTGEAFDDALTILGDAQDEAQECDCGERGDMGRHEYRYFNPSPNYLNKHDQPSTGYTPEEVRKYIRQDYERMEHLQRGDWSFIGIRAEAEMTGDLFHEITSGGLWGIESDSDKSYLSEVEQEQLSELRTELEAMGFSKRAVSAAFRNVEHSR